MIWNTCWLNCNAANACRIRVASIDSDFWIIIGKVFNIIKADMTKMTMPILKDAMLGGNLSWLRFNI